MRALLEKSDEDAENDSGNSPAWLALANGHVKVAEVLFEGGADLNLACEDGKTYLHQVHCARNSFCCFLQGVHVGCD